MAIEVVPARLYALSDVLDASALRAAQAGAAVPDDAVGGPLAAGLARFTETLRTAAGCVAGELGWLAGAVAAAADSWLRLDGSLLPRADAAVPE
jgi:hypothetical protein